MNYNKTFVFVAKAGQSLKTSGLSSTLADGQLGILNKSMTCVAAAPTYSASNYIHIALGNNDSSLSSFKSPAINPKKVTKYFGYAASSASTTGQVQISYVGFDEVDDTKSPTLDCGKSYGVGIRIWETYNNALVNPIGMTRTVVLNTDCCADCDGCGSVNCGSFFAKLADKINADSYLSKFITATAVGKPSAPTTTNVFSLTLPDPGTNVGGVADFSYTSSAAGLTPGTNNAVTGAASASGTLAAFDVVVGGGGTITSITLDTAGTGYVMGEAITIAGTSLTGGATPADNVIITVLSTTGAEGVLLDAVKALNSAFVDDVDTDIIITADTDGDQDANSTGNIRIELTPSAGVMLGDLVPYEGIQWEASTAASTSTACGLKIVGKALDLEYNECVPEAWNYAPRTVRFKLFAGENPEQVQDADVNWSCDPWAITTTQEVTFPYGAGYLIAEMERENYRYHLPNRARYYDPTFNVDVTLNANVSDTYYLFYIEFEDNYNYGSHQDASQDRSLAIVAIPYDGGNGTTIANSFETILDNYVTTNNTAFSAINIA